MVEGLDNTKGQGSLISDGYGVLLGKTAVRKCRGNLHVVENWRFRHILMIFSFLLCDVNFLNALL